MISIVQLRKSFPTSIALFFVGAMLALLLSLGTSAQNQALFTDDFEDGNANGWTKSGGSWAVVSDGSLVYRQSGTSADSNARAGSPSWTNISTQARVKPIAFNGADRYVGVMTRVVNSNHYYFLALQNGNRLLLGKRAGSSPITLATRSFTFSTGTFYTLRIDANGSSLSGYVNGTLLLTASDSAFTSGIIGGATYFASAEFDDFMVTSLGTVPTPTPTPTPTVSPTPTPTPTPTPPPTPTPTPPAGFAMIGFATVNALGQNGTTGGAGGQEVVVTTAAELADFIQRPEPLIIWVSGRIQFSDMLTVVANKSILGMGATAEITGGGLQLGSTTRPGNNVIIRNIKFSNASDDSISVTNKAHHVWIDHCEFTNGFDGLVDIKRESDFVTVSWNKFYNHVKTSLVGHSDTFTADIGHLRVTYHHNFFDGTSSRHPRVRFGNPVHVFNNYYRGNAEYGVASTENAGVLVEGNYFENVAFPCFVGFADSGPGTLVERDNFFVNSGVCQSAGTTADPRTYYNYAPDPAANVPSLVIQLAGVGKLGF
jgi:pectate lyase